MKFSIFHLQSVSDKTGEELLINHDHVSVVFGNEGGGCRICFISDQSGAESYIDVTESMQELKDRLL